MSVGLRAEHLAAVFPFHVAFDARLHIVQVGAAWVRASAAVRPGASVPQLFRLVRPQLTLSPESVQQIRRSMVILEYAASGLQLKGQIVDADDPEISVFLGSPVVRDLADLGRFGLSSEDWPVNESASDFLFLLQGKEAALADARALSSRFETQRTQLQAAARDAATSAAREAAIVDTALDAVVSIDQRGIVTLWNSQAETIFGWSREEAIGRPMAELIVPPDLRQAHHRGLERYLQTGEAHVLNQRIEITAVRRDGEQFPVELAITPIHEEGGASFSAFVRDITVRKRRERLLRMQYEVPVALDRALTLDDAAPHLLQAACEFLGWDVGMLWLEAEGPGRAELRCLDLWCQPAAAFEPFLAQSREMRFAPGEGLPGRVLASGRMLWLSRIVEDQNFPRAATAQAAGLQSAIALPITVAGRTSGVAEFFTRRIVEPTGDVTDALSSLASQVGQFIERRRAEQARSQSETRLRSVIDHMLEGLVVVGDDLRIVETNPAFARIFGYEQDALIGKSIVELMPDRPGYQDPANLTVIYRQSLGRVTEREGRRRNGEEFPMELQVYEVTTPHGTVFAGHVRDLSQEQEADRLKKQFVAAVSHELRTPLTAIRGSLSLLALGALGDLPPDAKEVVTMAERNTTRLVTIINDLLDLERLQAGLLSIARRMFPLDRAIARATEAVRPLAESAGITVVTGRSGASAWGDEARIVQVLVNLMGNAIKFSPAGSAVDVAVAPREADVMVKVIDRGRGVPEDMREIVFELFRQVEASDSRSRGGSGVGLAICRGIIAQHGGTIGVESEVGQGSTFWFTLPTRPPEPASVPDLPGGEPPAPPQP